MPELKELLRERHLKMDGNKQELITRLLGVTTPELEPRPHSQPELRQLRSSDGTGRLALGNLLLGVTGLGHHCSGGQAAQLPPLPGLTVSGVGLISLPISSAQAEQLAGVAQQAPFGKRMETVVDTTVRNVLQIEPDRVTFSNPAWDSQVAELVARAAQELGAPPRDVTASLYKVLLYEPGGFFLPHRDTEKAEGMFATLVIQPPSTYTGGECVVRHGSGERVFRFGTDTGDAAFGWHYMCHYADCEHEVKPITSGYRVVLVYSLCLTAGVTGVSNPSPGSFTDLEAWQHQRLQDILCELPPRQRRLLLPLEHQYTQASLAQLGFGALKGVDRARHAALSLASNGQLAMCLAMAVKADTSVADGEFPENGVHITRVFAASTIDECDDASASDEEEPQMHWDWGSFRRGGDVIAPGIDDGHIRHLEASTGGHYFLGQLRRVLHHTIGADTYPYTGNEGVTRLTAYHAAVLIVCDKKMEGHLLNEGAIDDGQWDHMGRHERSFDHGYACEGTERLREYESGEIFCKDPDLQGPISMSAPICIDR